MSTPGIELSADQRAALAAQRRRLLLLVGQVAIRVRVSAKTLHDWEMGKHRPSAAHYLAWLEVLGLRENSQGELEWNG